MRTRDLGWALWIAFGGAGCLGGETSVEEDSGSVRIEDYELFIDPTGLINAREGDDQSATVSVEVDGAKVTATGPGSRLPTSNAKSLVVSAAGSGWQAMGGQRTDLGFVLLHRNSQTPNAAWTPVTCGDRKTLNGYRIFEDSATIDLVERAVVGNAKAPFNASRGGQSTCGITESSPEFVVFVAPWYQWWNFDGTYDYTVSVDAEALPNPDADAEAAIAEWETSLVEDANPAILLDAYYAAIGCGDRDAVVSMWYSLTSSQRARVLRIAEYGQGWDWDVTPTLIEPYDMDTILPGDRVNVSVLVTARRGQETGNWTGTITVRWDGTKFKIGAMQLTAR